MKRMAKLSSMFTRVLIREHLDGIFKSKLFDQLSWSCCLNQKWHLNKYRIRSWENDVNVFFNKKCAQTLRWISSLTSPFLYFSNLKNSQVKTVSVRVSLKILIFNLMQYSFTLPSFNYKLCGYCYFNAYLLYLQTI